MVSCKIGHIKTHGRWGYTVYCTLNPLFEHHSQHQMPIGHGNSPYFADKLTCFSGHLGLFHQFFCFHEVTSFSTRHAFELFQTKSPFDGSWSVLLCYLILSYCPFLFALMMPNWLTHLVSWVSIRKSWNLKGMRYDFQPPISATKAGSFRRRIWRVLSWAVYHMEQFYCRRSHGDLTSARSRFAVSFDVSRTQGSAREPS